MLKYNESKVSKLLSEISLAKAQLEELQALSEPDFVRDKHKVASAKYNFIVVIEGCIDLCNHIIAQNNFRAPVDFADTFRILGENGFFDDEFVTELVKMAKFRNRLVHIYWEVNSHELYNILLGRLTEVQRFIELFSQSISKK